MAMRSPLVSSPAQARQTKEQFANPEDYLSYELGQVVKELPPLYTRLLAGSISLLVFGGLMWAHFSQVDEVAVAPGKLVPSESLRPVRALGDGIIREVKVEAGDQVDRGDILLERNQEISKAEVESLEQSAQLIREELVRLEAERTGKTTAGTNLQNQLLVARIRDFEARLKTAEAEAKRQLAVIEEAKTRLERLQENRANAKTNLVNAEMLLTGAKQSLAKAQEREKALSILVTPENSAFPRLDYIEAQNRVIQAKAEVTRAQNEITNAQDKVISIEKDIAAQKQAIRQAQQAYQAARQEAERLASERQSEILTRYNQRREEQATVEGQLEQAKKQQALETIKAPVAGTVYEVKATKGPVQAGEELLSILPEEEEVLLDVNVLNRDIGFVREGMKAKVKIDTFPFQEYGTIDGEVIHVSPNAIVDQDLGLVFTTTIKLKPNSINVRGQKVDLVPGMAARAEIVTRQKSILTFLIEPVTRRFSEAFSVR